MIPLEVLKNPHIPDSSFFRAKVQKYIFQSQLKGDLGIWISLCDLFYFSE